MSSDLGPAPDLDSVTPLSEVDPSVRDADFEKMLTKARVFLKRDPRVSEIDAEYLGSAIDGIIYIFLFKIGPVPSDGGAWFWVMVGDIPTAYASGEECKDPADALQAYIDSMAEWVEAARAGKSVEGLVPVNASPTPAYAEMLGSRLQFLEDNVMPILKGEEDNEEDDDEDDQGDESDEEDLSAEDRLPDLDSVTPLSEVDPSDRDAEFETMLTKARVFLERNQWVDGIDEEHLGAAFAGIVYIFLFKIRPAEAGIDSWYWVVVGDVPSAYATCGGCKDPPDALDAYIGAMTAWVEAARAGKSVADLVPVNISPTPEHAEMLRS